MKSIYILSVLLVLFSCKNVDDKDREHIEAEKAKQESEVIEAKGRTLEKVGQIYYQDNFNYSRVTAALALRWRWDFHNTAFDLQKARAELRMQEYQREAAELYLGQDVTLAYQDVVEADHRIELARRATELNWQLVVSLEQRDTVSSGGSTNELLRILKDWYKKRFAEAEAIHAHNEAVARLARATGTPLIAQSPQKAQKRKTASSSGSAESTP